MQQTVRLLNDLGERYGSEHEYFDLRSPAEAIKLLCINQPEFAKELAEAHEYGIGYTLVQAGELLGYDDLRLPLGSKDLILTPVVAGSGGSTGQIFLGVGLIAASFLLPGAGIFGTTSVFGTVAAGSTAAVPFVGAIGVAGTALGTALGTAISVIGASLILSGVSQMLSPQPVVPDMQDRLRPGENTGASGPQGVSRATSGQQSYAFSGPANTIGVGATVPLVYGELLIGSHLLSSKLEITEESDPSSDYFSDTGSSSVTINGEKVGNKFESLNGLRTRRWENSDIKGTSGDNRIKPNNKLSIREGADRTVEEVDNKNNEAAENLQVFLEINKGLFNVIGGKFVPAFVTYEILVGKLNYSGDAPTFARVRGTVQGLLKPSQGYKFCHAISYGEGGKEDGDTTVFIKVEVINTDAEEDNQIVVRGLGYNFFNEESENQTENLVEI